MSRQSKKIEKICPICNKTFFVIYYRIKKGKVKFCSKKCQGIETTRIKNTPEYFWSNVDMRANINLCWEWKKYKTNKGYGQFRYNNVLIYAHRLAYFLFHHKDDTEENQKLFVCHKCDNPSCCNPLHLFLGTNQDNVLDKVKKNRQLKGSANGNSKLDEFDVKQILLLKGILRHKTVAEMYKVSYSIISDIFNNRTWKHISREK